MYRGFAAILKRSGERAYKMSNTVRKQKKPDEKKKCDSYIWTDDEVELLLRVTNEYKVSKTMGNIDWESCHKKYSDILQTFKDQYPSSDDAKKIGKDYPHNKEELTQPILTSKLKCIRLKYRQAVDAGRRSGHGRVVLLYFELCEQIWGGSPATTTLQSGIETTEIDEGVHYQANDQLDQTWSRSASPASTITVDPDSPDRLDQATDDHEGQSSLSATVVKERRDLLDSKLAEYKKEKLKRKLPADGQLLYCAQEELKIKKQLLEKMENTDKEFSTNMNKLTSNIEKLTSSITDGFALLRQVMVQPSYAVRAPYPQSQVSSYSYGHMPAAPPCSIPVMQNTGQFPYMQSFMQDDRENSDRF